MIYFTWFEAIVTGIATFLGIKLNSATNENQGLMDELAKKELMDELAKKEMMDKLAEQHDIVANLKIHMAQQDANFTILAILFVLSLFCLAFFIYKRKTQTPLLAQPAQPPLLPSPQEEVRKLKLDIRKLELDKRELEMDKKGE